MKKYLHIFVAGRVQGVGFRYFVLQKAREFKLNGYTRNLFDGRVEVFVEGDAQAIEQFKFIVKEGPRFSLVEKINFTEGEQEASYSDFSIKSDGHV